MLVSVLTNVAKVIGCVITIAVGLLYINQDKLLYHPAPPNFPKTVRENPKSAQSPNEYNKDGKLRSRVVGEGEPIPFEDTIVRTADGVDIHIWLMLQDDSNNVPTLIYFHGNAGNMGMRLPNAALMYAKCKINVLMVDYRGYGDSTGTPSEKGLKLDALTVLQFAKGHAKLQNSKLVVFGRSLGGAVSVAIAESQPDLVSGIILENTFLSISHMVDSLMPFLTPIKWLVLRLKWDTNVLIARVKQPILFISGERDELVPPAHMRELLSLSKLSRFTTFRSVPNGGHNDSYLRAGPQYYDWLKEFIDDVNSGSTPGSTKTDFCGSARAEETGDEAGITLPTMRRDFGVN